MSTFLSFNSGANKYPSRRSVVYGKNGMVCTSQTLAAQAGLDILKSGGNAIHGYQPDGIGAAQQRHWQ